MNLKLNTEKFKLPALNFDQIEKRSVFKNSSSFLDSDKLKLPSLNVDQKEKISSINNLSPAVNKNKKLFKLDKTTKIKLNDGKLIRVNYDEFKEESIVGSGEFGVVKKMFHPPSNQRFAIKFLNENFIDPFNDMKKVNLTDLEVLNKIGDSSPYLIKFYGALFADSCILLITELCDSSLDKFCFKAANLRLKLPESFMAHIAFSVLSALSYMKSLKLIHRDVKPSNILINSNGDIKLCDFGISGFTKNSICNSFKGCQYYMAPEKIKISEKGYTILSDIWSLGISLIEISTGMNPYNRAKGIFELSTMILLEDSPQLDKTRFSAEYCGFIDQCLIKEQEQRPGCAQLQNHKFIIDNLNGKQKSNDLTLALINLVIEELRKDK